MGDHVSDKRNEHWATSTTAAPRKHLILPCTKEAPHHRKDNIRFSSPYSGMW